MLPQLKDFCMIYELNTVATRTGKDTDKNFPIHQTYTTELFTNKWSFQVTGYISGINRTHKTQDTWEKTKKIWYYTEGTAFVRLAQ